VEPFEDVKEAVQSRLIRSRTSQLAAQAGREQLEQLREGKGPQPGWNTPQLVSRGDPKELPEAALRQVFKADPASLPAYAGVEAPGGFMLLRVTRVVEPKKIDTAQQKQLSESLAQIVGEEQFTIYLGSLKSRAKVSLNKAQFEKADR
jgi:peptidyl-prolyl cis-trans isomerase D